MILRLLLFMLLSVLFTNGTESNCKNMEVAKAETYLETAASIIDRLRESLPEISSNGDCKCPPKPMDCDEVLKCGHNRSGVYEIWPRNRIIPGSIHVFCDMETNGGGWTLLQKRGDFQRPKDYFNKTWYEYKKGFGDLRRDFWLGNDNIHALTNQKKYYLRIDLLDFQNISSYAIYDQFWIENESHNYMLNAYDYSGDAGDNFNVANLSTDKHNGQMFSTFEMDNDGHVDNCADFFGGGWWYSNCILANLNGMYMKTPQNEMGIIWFRTLLQKTEMKIRPSDFQTDLLDMNVEPA